MILFLTDSWQPYLQLKIRKMSMFRDPSIAHDDSGGGAALGRHVRAEGSQTEALRRRTLLPAAGDIRDREQELRY